MESESDVLSLFNGHRTHTHTHARTQIVSATSNERQLEKDVLVGDGGGAPKGCRKTKTEQQERCWEPHCVRGCGSVCVCVPQG